MPSRSQQRDVTICSWWGRRGQESRCLLAGMIESGGINRNRPFREPHHTASTAASSAAVAWPNPGKYCWPITGSCSWMNCQNFSAVFLKPCASPSKRASMIARANAHIKCPCKFLLVAATNPCKCGYLTDPAQACGRAPLCGQDYLGHISGPLMDRFDLRLKVPPVSFSRSGFASLRR